MPASRKLRPRTTEPSARRIANYVNEHFGGNLSQAAAALGCNYDALRIGALGLTRRPNVALLMILAAHSGRSLDWWITGKEAV